LVARQISTVHGWDIVEVLPEARILIMYRNPCAATYSAFRRGFYEDIFQAAEGCAENLAWLAQQISELGAENIRIISYAQLCEHPLRTLLPIAEFCGLSETSLRASLENTPPAASEIWREQLADEEVGWLESYFDTQRRLNWSVLNEHSS